MRKIARILIPIILVVASGPILNLTAFHAWAAGFKTDPNATWHGDWANRLLLLCLLMWVLAGSTVFWLRPRRRNELGQPRQAD